MENITAVLLHYRNRSALVKAIDSLKQLGERLTSIFIFQDKQLDEWYADDRRIQFIPIYEGDLGEMVNDLMRDLTSSYVLFLADPAYFASNIVDTVLHFSQTKQIVGTSITYRNKTLRYPVMVPREFLLEQPLLSRSQLPFKEALLPAWLCKVDSGAWEWKEQLIKHSRKITSSNRREKHNFLYKYQLPKEGTSHPSISVMIANYNMKEYMEAAIKSCFLQMEQPEEVLIIDDGSTDHSRELLQYWKDRKSVV